MLPLRRSVTSARQSLFKFVIVLLITILVMPVYLLVGLVKVEARRKSKISESATINHRPPQPYFVNEGTRSQRLGATALAYAVSTAARAVGSIGGPASSNENLKKADQKSAAEVVETVASEDETETKSESEVEAESEAEVLIEAASAPPPSPPAVAFDFDGDGLSDLGRWHDNNSYEIKKSSDSNLLNYSIGSSSAELAPGDYNGDGSFDAGVYSGGTLTYKTCYNCSATNVTISSGTTGDKPVLGDFDGDGISDPAVWRPSTGYWYINKSGGGTMVQGWGLSGDIPAAGDFGGDSKTDFAIFRPSTGVWWISYNGGGGYNRGWGLSGDVPVPADYTGDGKTDIAVWRPSNGTWYVATSDSGFSSTYSQPWGNYGDQPVPADYDGDGTADMAVWRPKTRAWHIIYSSNSSLQTRTFADSGDTAIPSSYLKQSGYSVDPDLLGEERLKPRNATGDTNLYSQNFAWGRDLVSLPGRSGLDLNLGIGYNSLVWTKVGSQMVFDADMGRLTPGFHLGFPTIEPVFFNDATDAFTYLMISPSGARMEFRQTSVAGTYETVDGSYVELVTRSTTDPNAQVDDFYIDVRTTDGTLMVYDWIYGAFRCTAVRDRNGNYITVAYDASGNLTSVTDTLGRVVTVNYSSGRPSTITQTWKDTNGSGSNETHTWATFTYETTYDLDVDFDSSITDVEAPPNDYDFAVLKKITYADTSSSEFFYNNYGQVYKIENDADDDHKLNHVRTNLESPSADQTDCPRFTETRTWVENFNVDSEDTTPTEAEQEILVENSAPANSAYTVSGDSAQNTSVVEVEMPAHPEGLYQIIHFGREGWSEGLPLATRDCIGSGCSTEKRWSWNVWTQDGGSAWNAATALLNPRVTETRVGDGTNTKKTTISFYEPTSGSYPFSLPETITVGDLSTVMKTQTTTYNLSSDYTSRRIIGLPSETKLWEGTSSGTLMSKVTYGYDTDGYAGSGQSLSTPTQHATSSYGTGFNYRGNLTSTTRWDATAPTTEASAIISTIKYNIAGSPISQTTPFDGTNTRTVSISYADVWNDNVSRSTYAYPTTITDPGGFSSTIKYRFDIGANIEALGPAPDGNTYGKKSTRTFDSVGRLEKNSIWKYASSTWSEHAYTRYEYPSNSVQLKVYNTLVDVDNDGNIAEDEVLTESWSDGAGRVRMARSPHPGSTGGYSAVLTEYDILGRVTRQSVPTEVDSAWDPDGDDLVRGFVWNSQEYDWKGRTTRAIPSDSTGSDGKDTLISYAGCGCAGGVETTVQGPSVPTDVDPQTSARRKQKTFEDILGRTWKTQSFEWDGSTPYLTTEIAFNGRDQALTVERTDEDADVTQTIAMTYDGFGRTASKHLPQQDAQGQTEYTYYPDGSLASLTDARGAVTTYAYNSRGLLVERESAMPQGQDSVPVQLPSPNPTPWPSPTATPAPLNLNATSTFSYDNAGKPTSMTDELGSVIYAFNSLGQMVSETRSFNDTMPNAPLSNNRFALSYEYNLSGQLKSYTDPFGQQIAYTQDKVGRIGSVTGSTFGGVTSYSSSTAYRAWGGLKEADAASGLHLEIGYNESLSADSFSLQKTSNSSYVMNKNYDYYADGKLKYLQDQVNDIFDRLNTYDHAGRIKAGKSGAEARGGTVATEDQDAELPYRQSYSFNGFGNMTEVNNLHWGVNEWQGVGFDQEFEYENNRIQKTGWLFDEDGRITKSIDDNSGDVTNSTFDAAGKPVMGATTDHGISITHYDGNGQRIKSESYLLNSQSGYLEVQPKKYYIRSSVMKGRVVSEVWSNGKKHRSYVQGVGNMTAVQTAYYSEASSLYESVVFEFTDASGMSSRTTNKDGVAVATGDGGEGSPMETDPLGGSVGTHTPYITIVPPYDPDPNFPDLIPFGTSGNDIPGMDFGSLYSFYGSRIADLPGFGTNWGSFLALDEQLYEESVWNATHGLGFNPNEYYGGPPGARLIGYTLQYGNGSGPDGYWTTYEGAANNREGDEVIVPVWEESDDPFGDSQQQRDRLLKPNEVNDIRNELNNALGTEIGKKCRQFLNNSMKLLGSTHKDIMNVFEMYAAKRTIYDAPIGDGEAPFPASSSRAKLRLGVDEVAGQIQRGASPDTFVLLVFHELLHGSGRSRSYDHPQLATAMYGAATGLGIDLQYAPAVPDQKKLNSKNGFEALDERHRIDIAASQVWKETMNKACGGVVK